MGLDFGLYDFIKKAEYLRTKGFLNPQQMTLKKIYAFYETHKEIENDAKSLDLRMQIIAISQFKIKEGSDNYKKLIYDLLENNI